MSDLVLVLLLHLLHLPLLAALVVLVPLVLLAMLVSPLLLNLILLPFSLPLALLGVALVLLGHDLLRLRLPPRRRAERYRHLEMKITQYIQDQKYLKGIQA